MWFQHGFLYELQHSRNYCYPLKRYTTTILQVSNVCVFLGYEVIQNKGKGHEPQGLDLKVYYF